ncbi:hypothetical protein [Reinekea sp. G2M2-21]|uniref:hypothetical protein n=1 Tax=Reinekea sp. G2M2-21 TaxID=2788942 RepID=UPI0018A9665C|nr:hypothetical protein [Reinekea sp. G2M2-21]
MKNFFKRLLRRTIGSEVDINGMSDADICNQYGGSVLRSIGPAATFDSAIINEQVRLRLAEISTQPIPSKNRKQESSREKTLQSLQAPKRS